MLRYNVLGLGLKGRMLVTYYISPAWWGEKLMVSNKLWAL